MKRIALIVALVSFSLNAQNNLPEGWDKIMMDDKPAYMNINTGEVSTTYPKGKTRSNVSRVYKESVSTNYLGESHRVKRGETLSIISRKYGVTLKSLYNANPGINFNKLAVGQVINIATGPEHKSEKAYHIVKTGETLYRIALNNGVSTKKLIMLNRLTSNKIFIGQRLRLR